MLPSGPSEQAQELEKEILASAESAMAAALATEEAIVGGSSSGSGDDGGDGVGGDGADTEAVLERRARHGDVAVSTLESALCVPFRPG